MATKKQKRRRQKLKRHEYEYVIETEEGEELTVDRLSDEKAEKEKEKEKTRKESARGGRKIEPPSLQRVAKRTAIFGPLIVVLVFITSPSLSTSAKLFNALVLVAFFVPFSYMVDLIVYRVFRKRQAGGKPRGGKGTG